MQCPKCKYEPTMAEMQRSPADCVKCRINYADHGEPGSSGKPNAKKLTYLVVAVAIIVGLAFGGYGAYTFQQKQELIAKSEAAMRMANSYVAEILDKSANLTNAQYLKKIPRRIEELDTLVANSLAVDDQALPGLTAATASYVKGSRSFLNNFTKHLQSDINASVTRAGHRVYDDFAQSSSGQEVLSKSDEDLHRESSAAMSAVEAEDDLIARSGLVVAMVKRQQLVEKRQRYLDSKAAVEAADRQSKAALKALNDAGIEIGRLGRKVSEIAGKQMPVQAWQIPEK